MNTPSSYSGTSYRAAPDGRRPRSPRRSHEHIVREEFRAHPAKAAPSRRTGNDPRLPGGPPRRRTRDRGARRRASTGAQSAAARARGAHAERRRGRTRPPSTADPGGRCPGPSTPQTPRRATAHLRDAPGRVPGRDHDRSPSRSAVAGVARTRTRRPRTKRPAWRAKSSEKGLAHRSERRGTGPSAHEDRLNRDGTPRPRRRRTADPTLRPREFPESVSGLRTTRMPTRGRKPERGDGRPRAIQPTEHVESGRRSVAHDAAEPPDRV